MTEITIKDIAKECGVGISTVSRAINNHPDINPATRQKIMEVIERTGFIPNNSARNLKRTDAKCIAVLIKGISNPFFTSMIQIIEEETQRNRYALVIRHVEAYEDEIDVALELVKEKRLRGIIFLGGSSTRAEDKLARQMTVPCIFSTVGIGEPDQASPAPYSNIAVDDRQESRKMTEYLLGLGHRKIAIITENYDGPNVGQFRLKGYEDAFEAFGLRVDQELVWYVEEDLDHYSMENGYITTKKMLEKNSGVTAIYAVSDSLAIGACRALLEAGKRIPGDVSVAGFDGISLGEYYNPKLTTIKQPVEEMAIRTIRLIMDVIDGREKHQNILFPARLIERESTAAPAKFVYS